MDGRAGVDIAPAHGVDNIAMAISLTASTRGLSLMPAYEELLALVGREPPVERRSAYYRSGCRVPEQ